MRLKVNNGKMTSYYTNDPVRHHHFYTGPSFITALGTALLSRSLHPLGRTAASEVLKTATGGTRCKRHWGSPAEAQFPSPPPLKVKTVYVHDAMAYNWSRRIVLLIPNLHGRL